MHSMLRLAATLRRLLPVAALFVAPRIAGAQTAPSDTKFAHSNSASVVGGMSQIILGGGNIEGTWYTEHMSFEYSHGFNLKLSGSFISSTDRNQKLALREPWTTGFGVGYRVTSAFDVRLEGKAHHFQLYYDDQSFKGAPIGSYTTATVGVGAYYRYYPWAQAKGWARGLVLNPSARFWPNVWSSLDHNRLSYDNTHTGRPEIHEAATQGIPGTKGLFVNVSLGYTF